MARKSINVKAQDRGGSRRAFRGLVLFLSLSILNFAGLVLTATAIGALESWSTWQFAALFGVVEIAAGIAGVVLPNIWHLPVVELETSNRTRAHLALSSLVLAHWGSLARSAAGVVLLIGAGYEYGFAPGSLLMLPLALLIAAIFINVSLLAARWGVAKPDLDVVQLLVRWRGDTRELKPLSLSAALLQFVLGIITLPTAQVLKPGALFAPELQPSAGVMLVVLVVTIVTSALTWLAWNGRITWQAPQEQQAEVEAHA